VITVVSLELMFCAVTIPVLRPTVATPGNKLDQVPPEGVAVSVVVARAHSSSGDNVDEITGLA